MTRPYFRVTPTAEPPNLRDIPEALASLHKLRRRPSGNWLSQLIPLPREPPIRYEFVALSQGADQPVEFYYGADDQLDALQLRLRQIYPASFDIETLEEDLTKRVLRPVELSREEFADRLEDGRLYHEFPADAWLPEEQPIEQPSDLGELSATDGGGVDVSAGDAEDGADHIGKAPADSDTETEPDGPAVDLNPPSYIDRHAPATALERPTETTSGTILARPALADVEPYGVQWFGKVDRRKDWMTTLKGLTEMVGHEWESDRGSHTQARLPLAPVLEQLATARQPLAYQVVFQAKQDWSKSAMRQSGALLGGSDTFLQRFLSVEPLASGRSSTGGRRSRGGIRGGGSRSPPGVTHRSRPPRDPEKDTKDKRRLDLVKANSPKLTFTVNVRAIGIPLDDDERRSLETRLDALWPAFDLVDGPYYEMDGRRLRSRGVLPGSGGRQARAALEQFSSRSVTNGGRRPSVTKRGKSRPSLILNGDELANFVVIRSVPGVDVDVTRGTRSSRPESDDKSERATGSVGSETTPEGSSGMGQPPGSTGGLSSVVPDVVVNRTAELERLANVLEPLARDEQTDTVLITGRPGTGKTCVTASAVDGFLDANPDFEAVYVNCWEDGSTFQVLYRILDAVGRTVDIHRQSTPQDVLLERLRTYDGLPCIVIFDEADQLEEKDILYDLLGLSRFTFLFIANRADDVLGGVDDRLESRLRGTERLEFGRYTEGQLVDILDEVASSELDGQSVDRSTFEAIASLAGGDARVATTVLRIAARRADGGADGRITPANIDSALPVARQELRRKTVEDLAHHERAVYQVIEDTGRVTPSELYGQYRDRVENPKTDRTVRNYLTKLERYNLVISEGSFRDRVYRCVGHRTVGGDS